MYLHYYRSIFFLNISLQGVNVFLLLSFGSRITTSEVGLEFFSSLEFGFPIISNLQNSYTVHWRWWARGKPNSYEEKNANPTSEVVECYSRRGFTLTFISSLQTIKEISSLRVYNRHWFCEVELTSGQISLKLCILPAQNQNQNQQRNSLVIIQRGGLMSSVAPDPEQNPPLP